MARLNVRELDPATPPLPLSPCQLTNEYRSVINWRSGFGSPAVPGLRGSLGLPRSIMTRISGHIAHRSDSCPRCLRRWLALLSIPWVGEVGCFAEKPEIRIHGGKRGQVTEGERQHYHQYYQKKWAERVKEGRTWKDGRTEEDRGSCFSTMQARNLDTMHMKLVPPDPECRDM